MRRKPAGRLHQIAAGAATILSERGYRLAQMADVARECDLSAGALYSYVESKEALLHLALSYVFEIEPDENDLPYRISFPKETLNLLKHEIERDAIWPVLSERLQKLGSGLHSENIAEVAAELFDMMHRRRRAIWLLDRCAKDVPKIAALYVKHVKVRYLKDLEALISRGQSGRLIYRDVDAASAARGVLEMVAWFAVHRLRDAVPLPRSEEKARGGAISLAVHALCRSPVKSTTRIESLKR
jgi:AcrR family transcriptional regulator